MALSLSLRRKLRIAKGGAVLYPVNSVAPAVTGTTEVGQTLTTTTGTWSNTPTSYVKQWYQVNPSTGALTAIGTDSLTYVLQPTDATYNIRCVVTAVNASGQDAAASNTVGPVTLSSSITTPTVARTSGSAANSAPLLLDIGMGADVFAGMDLHVQIATDSGFTSITQDFTHFLTGDERANETMDWTGDGFLTPSGLYYLRCRWERADGVNSSWSTTFTETISASVAVWQTTTGTSKNSAVTVSGTPALSVSGGGFNNVPQCVRTATAATDTNAQWEFTVTTMSGTFGIGMDNGTRSLAGSGAPGLSDNTGIWIALTASSIEIYWNSAGSGGSGAAAVAIGVAVGDTITVGYNQTTGAVAVFRTRSGTTTAGPAATVTGSFLQYAYADLHNNEAGTANFGGSAFVYDLGNGIYG